MSFFTEQLGFSINEYSPIHFVIYSKGIRIMFTRSDKMLEVEFYLRKSEDESSEILEDPNQIKIIIS
jgi:hypothetical protein